MISRWYVGLLIALLLAPSPAQTVLWQTPPKPTTGNPMPDPCERAPNLPFCK